MVEYARVTLSYTSRFYDDEIIACIFTDGDGIVNMCTEGLIVLSCGQTPHISTRMVDGIHPDAVAQQRTSGLLLRRIHGNDSDRFVRAGLDESPDDLIGDGRLTRASGTRDAQYRRAQIRNTRFRLGCGRPALRIRDGTGYLAYILPFAKL